MSATESEMTGSESQEALETGQESEHKPAEAQEQTPVTPEVGLGVDEEPSPEPRPSPVTGAATREEGQCEQHGDTGGEIGGDVARSTRSTCKVGRGGGGKVRSASVEGRMRGSE